MTDLTLIRHGQANSGARDEASYDRLSDRGHRQARWLGAHLAPLGRFDRVISGTLRRQRETAAGLNPGDWPHDTDPRLNELDYFGLSHALRDNHGVPFPDNPASFAAHVPQVLDLWRSGGQPAGLETYADFRARIMAALHDAAAGPGRPLLVTSTGVIATLTAIALDLDTAAKSRMFLAVAHTSVHRFALRGDALHLVQFGATPHLDTADRAADRTFV
jgi:broad specificity phosphatase PhoE